MRLYIVRFADGRRVEFTAFSHQVALDWAATQGRIVSWNARPVGESHPVIAPVWL